MRWHPFRSPWLALTPTADAPTPAQPPAAARWEQHRYREAIAQLETLLGSSLDDRDLSGYLMEAYQNYHHRACVETSACHEGLGDYPSALRFAVLARDAYPYQTWCGTCEEEAHKELAERIARLERDGDKAR